MRAVASLFFAFATFCLGVIAVSLGASRAIALLLGRLEPDPMWDRTLLGVSLGLSIFFLVVAAYYVSKTRDDGDA